MLLGSYLALLRRSQTDLSGALRHVGSAHGDEVDVAALTRVLAEQCEAHVDALEQATDRYDAVDEPPEPRSARFGGPREGPLGLIRDLQDLYVMACECDIAWTLIGQAAQGAHDQELIAVVGRCEGETSQQLAWLRSRMKQAAPQALVVA